MARTKPKSAKASAINKAARDPPRQTSNVTQGYQDGISNQNPFRLIVSITTLLLASELSGITSQLSLSPVFGGIASNLHHEFARVTITLSALCLAFVPDLSASRAGSKLHDFLERQSTLIALHLPFALPWFWRAADDAGAEYGPVLVEGLSFYLVRWMLLGRVAFKVGALSRSFGMRQPVIAVICLGLSLVGFKSLLDTFLMPRIGSSWWLSRHGLQYTLAALVASTSSWSNIITCLPGLLYPLYFSPGSPFRGMDAANRNLAPYNHTLLARTDSVTGYVSIIENNKLGYRVMRCDHSLLGGEWLKDPAPGGLREPIYAAFVLLEAVRLAEPHARDRQDPEALLIGLGIGTSATGLIQHGVKTTIVEVDPAVYKYAKEYFALPNNHTAYITDAVSYIHQENVKQSSGADIKQYDYILHDVFTGGAVPAPLFTEEFLQETKSLLKPEGIIAINYAGDLNLKPALSIVHTILSVYTYCRAFRDSPRQHPDDPVDFVNMVIFCTPFRKQRPYFHPAIDEDFHKTYIRKQYMTPKYEVDLDELLANGKNTSEGLKVITRKNVDMLEEWQKESAISHWKIMKKVMPQGVWRNY